MDNNIKTRLRAYFRDYIDTNEEITSVCLYDLQEMKKELIQANKSGENSADIKELEIIINLIKAANFEEYEYINFI